MDADPPQPAPDDSFSPVPLEDPDPNPNPNPNPTPLHVPDPDPDPPASPLISPRRPRPRPSMPDVPPELSRLLDPSALSDTSALSALRSAVDASPDASRSVVDALLAAMGGVDGFDAAAAVNDPPAVMVNPHAAPLAARLIPSLPSSEPSDDAEPPRSRMARGLLAILQACTRNRAMCSDSGLFPALLDSVETIYTENCSCNDLSLLLCDCIQTLCSHSLTVKDLRSLLVLVKKTLTTEWSTRLMLALEKAVGSKEAKGPKCTFEFDGESSGLLGPGESRWPFSNGYAFATWIYIESFEDTLNTATAAAAIAAAAAATSGKSSAMSAAAAASALAGEGTVHMPRLFSFISSDNYGVEAYFHGQFLVVETGGGGAKGRKNSLHFTHSFKPQCWYFVGLEHSCKQGLMGKSENELRLYIDGRLFESRPFEFPRVTKSLAFCCIGTNPPPTMAGLQRRRRQCPLFAEMGPVYIFKEPIGPERMSRLSYRGGNTLPSFGIGAGVPSLGFNDNVRSLVEDSWKLDAEIGGSLHLLYHPNLLSGRLCQDASPSGAAGTHRRPAEVLGQVHVAVRVRPLESLWALAYGGPMALLPLTVSNVQMDNLEPICDDFSLSRATASLAAPVFRIISMAIQHPGNTEELCRTQAPEILSRILRHLLQKISMLELGKYDGQSDEELVASILSLCQSQKKNHALKVHFFRTLLLDLKLWSFCNYGLQKKLLSSLADMVFTESSAMRDANALHMLLDGCRRCFWVVREADSVDTSSIHKVTRPIGEVNALVDELMVVIELLVGAAASTVAAADVHCLIGFLVDCPQPNQVARVLLLLYRLVVQPNTSRANTFSQAFISSGGIEALFVLLQREAKAGNHNILETCSLNSTGVKDSGLETASSKAEAEDDQLESSQPMESVSSKEDPESDPICIENVSENDSKLETASSMDEGQDTQLDTPMADESVSHKEGYEPESLSSGNGYKNAFLRTNIERQTSTFENEILKSLGGISFKINADSARNNVYNIDNADGVVVGLIKLLGALFTSGHLKFGLNLSSSNLPSKIMNSGRSEEDTSISGDKVSLLLFALQKAFQAAPQRLMTKNVYMALVGATINVSSTDDGINLYDSGHRFEHAQLLLVLLRSLPYASRGFQVRAIQDLLFLACSHQENRSSLTLMEEWPEWILEVLISNYEIGANKSSDGTSIVEIEDLIHNFLIIMLEHSMRMKDGWKDVEATIHSAEWLSMIGGSSTGQQRVRREESLPLFKRRLLGGLLDFAARELQVQTQVIAAAAAGVAAEGLSPQEAKAEAEQAAHRSVALAENAIVILMLVEDHLRSGGQLLSSSHMADGRLSNDTSTSSAVSRTSSIGRIVGDFSDTVGSRRSSVSSDTGGLSLDVLASMADANGQISAAVMERLTAAAAAEPYESVRCAFVSYGSCALDLSEGWKYRSRMWYGVGLPSKSTIFGGGGSGWEMWNSVLEKDSNGKWIELPLVKKSVTMLQALLLDECGLGGGLGIGGGSGTGMGGMAALYQLLDSDQPFLCMLRMVLASMREDDNGDGDILMTNITVRDGISEGLNRKTWNMMPTDGNNTQAGRKSHSALLWSVLAPILNMPISETKRQRVLVAVCVLYAEVWHAVGKDRNPIRKQYLEAIVPPYIAILRRWRPLLAGIHELTSTDGQNPLIADDRALAADVLPLEAALSMITPGWAAAFASPPAAMALAMMAAGAAGVDTATHTRKNTPGRRETSLLDRKTTRTQSFASFQKLPDASSKPPPVPKDRAAAKAIALAAARDLERNAKIGSGRGLSAVAMATSSQRRRERDIEQSNRWNISEAMGTAWTDCLQSIDSKSISSQPNKYVALLVASFSLAREIQWAEIDRRLQVNASDRSRASSGTRAWRKLIHRLVETGGLFGPFGGHLSDPERVFWKLDFVESSSRMRRCLVRNFKGSDHLGAAADYEDQVMNPKSNEDSEVCNRNSSEASLTANLPSTTSILMSEAISTEGNENDEETETDNFDSILDNQQRLSSITDQSLKGPNDARVSEASGDQNSVRSTPTVSLGYVPSEIDEKVILEVSSLLVRPLKVVRGTFKVTTMRINFIVDEQNAGSSTRGITSDTCEKNNETNKNRSWLVSCLLQMYSRRYLLRTSALELFMVDRSNFFFDFGSMEVRKKAYRAIVQARPPHLSNIYLAAQRPEQLFRRTQLMERWARWEISNFEYLMELNTMAGRTYNDITQYPVFPWILADYSSKMLDLSNPSSYRDLSKPVGALNPDRLEKFQERYSSFEDPVIPKFHYGSHYSSAGTVLYYLVRVEPFTTLSINLQGGKFDHADRMFSDIPGTWNGVLEDMSDVKELVPEMFYLPEILTNGNSIDFGTTQLGEKLDSVKLPPWAENPVDFIHKHRMALESEHVSSHLHEWIDLVFGCKQRGKEAVAANNVFFYITYEGTVDIDKITDPVLQRATQDQIAYFGQTPSQLLTTPHLKKRSLADALHLQTIFRNPNEIRPYVVPNHERCNVPAGAIFASEDSVIVVDVNAPAANVALHKWQPNTPDGQGTPFLFQHGKAAASSSGGAFMRMFKGPAGSGYDDWQYPRAVAFAASGIRSSAIVAVTCDREIVTGGHADNSVKLVASDGAKTIETASGHCAPVTCLALSPDCNFLVTGSRDNTVLLWKLHRASSSHYNNLVEPSTAATKPTSPLGASNSLDSSSETSRGRRIEGPIHVLRGHLSEIISCSVSSDLGIAASSSHSSGVLLHSLRRGQLLRKLYFKEADKVCLSSQGIVMLWNKSQRRISTFTVNGVPIATTILSPFSGTISCIEISLDGKSALIGTSSSTTDHLKDDKQEIDKPCIGEIDLITNEVTGNKLVVPVPSICFLDLHTLEVFHSLVLKDNQDITAIALNKDNTNLLVSTADKQLIVFTDPTLSLKVVDQMLRLGWEGGGLSR